MNLRGRRIRQELEAELDLAFARYMYPDYTEMDDQSILDHFGSQGKIEGRLRSWREAVAAETLAGKRLPERFNEDFYLRVNPDLREEFSAPGAASWHYLRFGHQEGRSALSELLSAEHCALRTYRVFDPLEVVVDNAVPTRVNVLVPAFDTATMSAGFFGVFQVALWLDNLGYRVRLVMFENFAFYLEDLKATLRKHSGLKNLTDRVEVYYAGERRSPLVVSGSDQVVATVWYSAYLAEHIMQAMGGGPFLYLIQDDESTFHPNGSAQVLARDSYSLDYYALVSTTSLLEHFYLLPGSTIQGDPSRALAFQNAAIVAPYLGEVSKRLVFYSRPTVDRNLFDLGIQVLREWCRRNAERLTDWEFLGIGIGEIDVELLDGRYLQHVPRMSIEQYAEFLTSVGIGLSLMASPHPSMVPIELAGSGVPVVTNTWGTKTSEWLRGVSPNILVAPPNVPGLVDALERAYNRSFRSGERRIAAEMLKWPKEWTNVFTSEHEKFVEKIFGAP